MELINVIIVNNFSVYQAEVNSFSYRKGDPKAIEKFKELVNEITDGCRMVDDEEMNEAIENGEFCYDEITIYLCPSTLN